MPERTKEVLEMQYYSPLIILAGYTSVKNMYACIYKIHECAKTGDMESALTDFLVYIECMWGYNSSK